MRFGFGPAKTTAFKTDGMRFDALKRKLDKRIKELNGPEDAANDQAGAKVLDGSAQIRWTAKNGIYVKKGTWNTKGWDPFGSDILERGDKFLGARDEIARSINLTFGFTLNEDGQLIGDYLVDSLLKERVRNEMGAEDIANLDDAELQRRKQNIYLRLDDLDELQQKVDEIRDRELAQQFDQAIEQGAKWGAVRDQIIQSINKRFDFAEYKKQSIGYHLVDELLERKAANIPNLNEAEKELRKQNFDLRREDLQELQQKIDDFKHHPERLEIPQAIDPLTLTLTASVGYLHGGQSKIAVQAGTEALLKSAERDILAQKKGDVSKEDFEANSEKYEKEARKMARRILIRLGMTTERDQWKSGNVDETNTLEGGLTWRNAANVSFSLHLNGVTDLETMALLQSTTLPGKINTIGNRLFALDKELHNHLPNLPKDWDDLSTIRDQIRKVVSENRGLMLELKKMSYPDDVINPAKRQEFYNRLAANIENMDAVVKQLYDLLQEGGIDKGLPFWSDIEKAVDIAEEICLETLALASAVYPRIRAKSGDRNKPQPKHIELPGLTAWHHVTDNFKGRVGKALDQGLKAPDILFRADSTHQKNYSNAITRYNKRLQRLKNGREWYHKNKSREEKQKTNVVWQPPKSLVKEDPDTEYRLDLISAFQENEELAGAIRRRQMILGETGDFKRRVGKKDDENIYDQSGSDLLGINRQSIANREKTGADLINDEMDVLKEQRRALILLLYPNLTRAPVGQAAPVQAFARNSGASIEEESVDSSTVSTDPYSGNQVNIERSVLEVHIDASSPSDPILPEDYNEDDLSQVTIKVVNENLYKDENAKANTKQNSVFGLGVIDEDDEADELPENANLAIINQQGIGLSGQRPSARLAARVSSQDVDLPFAGKENDAPNAARSDQKFGGRLTLEQKLQVDCGALENASRSYWSSFKEHNDANLYKSEQLQGGGLQIFDEVEAVLKKNDELLARVGKVISGETINDSANRQALSQDMWRNFASLAEARQKLEAFRNQQLAAMTAEARTAPKSLEKYRQSIRNAGWNLEQLNEFILATHSLAYELSGEDAVKGRNDDGLVRYSQSMMESFERTPLKYTTIKSEGHPLAEHGAGFGSEMVDKERVSRYLAELEYLSRDRSVNKQEPLEVQLQKRIERSSVNMLPHLKRALKLNTDLSFQLKGGDLDLQYELGSREEQVVSRLKNDREDLLKLRLDELMKQQEDQGQLQGVAELAATF